MAESEGTMAVLMGHGLRRALATPPVAWPAAANSCCWALCSPRPVSTPAAVISAVPTATAALSLARSTPPPPMGLFVGPLSEEPQPASREDFLFYEPCDRLRSKTLLTGLQRSDGDTAAQQNQTFPSTGFPPGNSGPVAAAETRALYLRMYQTPVQERADAELWGAKSIGLEVSEVPSRMLEAGRLVPGEDGAATPCPHPVPFFLEVH
ncbi:hypothetical protein Q8A67_025585 [Cirrhinus molitorella]|uniref:Uncharacterized protein n=1 Tax=Cirrhinus molitorella TaxID=172907 RepID=A0AA88P8Q0_9TELE|nr:hypothetical protein Q8A67_025585 [Cirrhinus molitorella]